MSATPQRALCLLLSFVACSGLPPPDGGVGGIDAGIDAGSSDAGSEGAAGDGGGSDGGVADAGSIDGGGRVDAGVALPIADLCPQLAEATCARAERCGWLQAAQRDACLRTQRVICENADNFGPAIRGLQTYDGVSARTCVERTRELACASSPTETDNSCGRIITAQVGLGAACTRSQQSCSRGSICAAQTPDQCACVPLVAEGGDCSLTPCALGLSCVNDGGTPTCAARQPDGAPCTANTDCTTGRCTPELDGGSRCGFVPTGERCDVVGQRSCASTDYCRGVRYAEFGSLLLSEGTCAPRVTGACAVEQLDDGCPFGQWCSGGVCTEDTTFSVPEGGACSHDGQCRSGFCEGDGSFLADGGPNVSRGRCAGQLSPGSPCSSGGPPCAAPASCISNACALPPAEGQPCSQLCTFLTYCPPNGSQRVCTALRAAGASCSTNLRCEEGLFCDTDGGVCSPPRPVGAACTAAAQCQTELCRTDAGVNGSPTRPGSCQPTCL